MRVEPALCLMFWLLVLGINSLVRYLKSDLFKIACSVKETHKIKEEDILAFIGCISRDIEEKYDNMPMRDLENQLYDVISMLKEANGGEFAHDYYGDWKRFLIRLAMAKIGCVYSVDSNMGGASLWLSPRFLNINGLKAYYLWLDQQMYLNGRPYYLIRTRSGCVCWDMTTDLLKNGKVYYSRVNAVEEVQKAQRK